MAAVDALAWEGALRQLPAQVDPEDPEVAPGGDRRHAAPEAGQGPRPRVTASRCVIARHSASQ